METILDGNIFGWKHFWMETILDGNHFGWKQFWMETFINILKGGFMERRNIEIGGWG